MHTSEFHHRITSFFLVRGTQKLLLFSDFDLNRREVARLLCESGEVKNEDTYTNNQHARRATNFRHRTLHSTVSTNSSCGALFSFPSSCFPRSEERRVGKEWRS